MSSNLDVHDREAIDVDRLAHGSLKLLVVCRKAAKIGIRGGIVCGDVVVGAKECMPKWKLLKLSSCDGCSFLGRSASSLRLVTGWQE
jgi:hypothetical protein